MSTALTLVSGGSYAQREAAIAAALPQLLPGLTVAVLLEGLPDGQPELQAGPQLLLQRIAPGCLCCIGNLALRVTLNRLLRRRPAHLFLAVAGTAHLENLRLTLQQAPYDHLLLAYSTICL
ncbi:MAG: GTPase [Burkholderiales bacterium]|nr:GTPase [Burkholderiales bacterium]